MKITPLDIRKHAFPKALRGYDAREVEAFLFLVAEEFERLVHEREALKEKGARLESQLAGFDEREQVLKRTLYTAQQAADGQKENARREAELTRKEAELRAEQIIEAAQRRCMEIERDIMELKQTRQRMLAEMERLVEDQRRLLESKRAKSAGEDKVEGFTRPRQG